MGLPKGRTDERVEYEGVQVSILSLWCSCLSKTRLPVGPTRADSSYCLQVALKGQDLATPW